MIKFPWRIIFLSWLLAGFSHCLNAQILCSESRKALGTVSNNQKEMGKNSIWCSQATQALLWWLDPFEGTVAMQPLFAEEDFLNENARIKPVTKTLKLNAVCGMACHNGVYPPILDNTPRKLVMHTDVVPDATQLQHGNGTVWCLDCHHNTQRKNLTDRAGQAIPMDAAPKLCGSCHAQVYSQWKINIHGKTLGEWRSDGKKRWFGCTECHNPHDVVNGLQASGFAAVPAEPITHSK